VEGAVFAYIIVPALVAGGFMEPVHGMEGVVAAGSEFVE
jgi:hypothetical protein